MFLKMPLWVAATAGAWDMRGGPKDLHGPGLIADNGGIYNEMVATLPRPRGNSAHCPPISTTVLLMTERTGFTRFAVKLKK